MIKSNVFEHTVSSNSKKKRKIKLIAKDSPIAKATTNSDYYFGSLSSQRSPVKQTAKNFRLNATHLSAGGDPKSSRLESGRKYLSPEELASQQAEALILNLRVLSTLSNQLGGR